MTDSSTSSNAAKRAEPESFRARSLQASFTVKDVQASLDWYTNVLGFTLDEKYEREGRFVAASLKAGDVRVLIGQDDGKKGWDRVKQAGGTRESEPMDMPWGARTFSLRDPDGFKLVISSERPDRA